MVKKRKIPVWIWVILLTMLLLVGVLCLASLVCPEIRDGLVYINDADQPLDDSCCTEMISWGKYRSSMRYISY